MKTERFVIEKVTWKDLEESGYASVTDYCRYLIKNHPEDLPSRIEIYRGEMLCMTVTDVTLAAKLEPATYGFQKYVEGSGLKPRRGTAKPRGRVSRGVELGG